MPLHISGYTIPAFQPVISQELEEIYQILEIDTVTVMVKGIPVSVLMPKMCAYTPDISFPGLMKILNNDGPLPAAPIVTIPITAPCMRVHFTGYACLPRVTQTMAELFGVRYISVNCPRSGPGVIVGSTEPVFIVANRPETAGAMAHLNLYM
jgi:hypothetical protein